MVSYPSKQISAKNHALLNKFLQVSYPSKQILRGIQPQRTTFEFEYLCNFEIELKNNLGCDSGVHMESIHKKTEAENQMLLL
jgi:hypothetical protein